MVKTGIVNRTFQIRADENNFNWKYFQESTARSINNLLRYKEIGTITVVINSDPKSHLAEIVNEDGKPPSMIAFEKSFPEEIRTEKIIILCEKDWGGPNPGSPKALNDGIDILKRMGEKYAMCYSTEIEITGYHISKALNFMKEENLTLVDFLMKGWWQSVQQRIPRNLCSIWEIESFNEGFSSICSGSDEKTVLTELGEVRVAGMEAFFKMLEDPNLRWGMLRLANPPIWNNDFPPGDKERWKNHYEKLARQGLVMIKWSNLLHPDTSYETVMDNLFSLGCYFQK